MYFSSSAYFSIIFQYHDVTFKRSVRLKLQPFFGETSSPILPSSHHLWRSWHGQPWALHFRKPCCHLVDGRIRSWEVWTLVWSCHIYSYLYIASINKTLFKRISCEIYTFYFQSCNPFCYVVRFLPSQRTRAPLRLTLCVGTLAKKQKSFANDWNWT